MIAAQRKVFIPWMDSGNDTVAELAECDTIEQAQAAAKADGRELLEIETEWRAPRQTVILVSCCGAKLAQPAPARDLYQSQLFKAARRYAEASGHQWMILSAKYGAVHPDDVIAPYDQRLPSDIRPAAKNESPLGEWYFRTSFLLRHGPHGSINEPTAFISLCGAEYTRGLNLTHGIYAPTGHTLEEPLKGMAIGQRLAWLKANTAQLLEVAA